MRVHESMSGPPVQSSFRSPEEKIREVLEMASRQEYDYVFALISGGTDSLCALDAYLRFREDYDLPPVHLAVQTNTGTTLPTTLETAREFCARHGISYVELLNKAPKRMLGPRVLTHGWPANSQGGPTSGGHWMEFINRKQDTWDGLYGSFPGKQLWISGGRVDESDRRAQNLGDGAVDFGDTGDRHPRKTWVAPVHGLLDGEKEAYINEHDIPETLAYDLLGYSGDCTACSFDDPRVLNEIRIVCPELAWALETLICWVYVRIRTGEIDQPIARSVWGTDIQDAEEADVSGDGDQRTLQWAGCSEPNCRASRARDPEDE